MSMSMSGTRRESGHELKNSMGVDSQVPVYTNIQTLLRANIPGPSFRVENICVFAENLLIPISAVTKAHTQKVHVGITVLQGKMERI